MDRTKLAAAGDGFYLKINSLNVTASVNGALPTFNANLGLLGLSVGPNAGVNLTASIGVTFANSDGDLLGRLTVAELQTSSIAALIAGVNATGSLSGGFPIHAQLDSFAVNTTITLGMDGGNLFAGALPTLSLGDARLSAFGQSLTADGFLSALSQGLDWLDQFRASSVFAQAIPLIKSLNLGERLGLGSAFNDAVNSLLTNASGQANFVTIQDVIAKVASFAGADYDPTTRELTYRVNLNKSFDSGGVDLDLGGGLGSLANISTSSQLSVTGNLSASFTMGLLLTPLDKGFHFTLRDGTTFTADLSGTTSVAEIAAHLAALTNKVTVVADPVNAGKLKLTDGSTVLIRLVAKLGARLCAKRQPQHEIAGAAAGLRHSRAP